MENTITIRNSKGNKVNRPAATPEEQLKAMQAELAKERAKRAEAEAETARLKASKIRDLSCRVSPKGALSVYGLGRFPVTLYRQQWTRVLDAGDMIREFIEDHDNELSVKQ